MRVYISDKDKAQKMLDKVSSCLQNSCDKYLEVHEKWEEFKRNSSLLSRLFSFSYERTRAYTHAKLNEIDFDIDLLQDIRNEIYSLILGDVDCISLSEESLSIINDYWGAE